MKWIDKLVTWVVGGLFIFSGLIKVNDPVGTAIKLEEYFEVFAVDFSPFFHHLIPFALIFSVFLCILEVVLGVALISNFKPKLAVSTLLLTIVFFTFLTFYSAYFNKVTDCGCFGDAIKLTPWESFTKDIVLLVLIGWLALRLKHLQQSTSALATAATVLGLFIAGGIAWYALSYLPPIDFRVYKVGNNIKTLMQPEEPCQYQYIMTKNGKEYVLDEYPAPEEGYEYKALRTVNSEKCTPRITDYNIWNDEGSYTQETLNGACLMVIVKDVKKANSESFTSINKLLTQMDKSVEPIAVTSSDGRLFEAFRHEVQLATPYYFADATVLKTMMRSDPGLLLLKDGQVLGKWHYNSVPSADEIKKLLH